MKVSFLLFLFLSLPVFASLPPEQIRIVRSPREVKRQLEFIQANLPKSDGIAPFNSMYIATTTNIYSAATSGRFEDPRLIKRFIVTFANLYFSALRMHLAQDERTPLAWQPMFRHEHDLGRFKTVQLAMAGMLAHIGRDLPVVLQSLFKDRKAFPKRNSSEYRDYLTVNEILEETFDQIENDLFADTLNTRCQKLWRGTADVFAVPSIKSMRAKAWIDGKMLWKLRSAKLLAKAYIKKLDYSVGLVGSTVFTVRCSTLVSK